MKSTSHASYQTHQNISFRQKNRPKRIASELETHQLNQAIVALSAAKSCTNEKEFLEKVSTAFNNTRSICRSRIL